MQMQTNEDQATADSELTLRLRVLTASLSAEGWVNTTWDTASLSSWDDCNSGPG